MPDNYLAITIGPIFKLINQAKTTRELWVISYFLSKLSKLLISYTPTGKDFTLNLLSPQLVPAGQTTYGAGVYPDRVYWTTSKELTDNDIAEIQKNVLNQLAVETSNLLDKAKLEKYVKTYWLQMALTKEQTVNKPFLFHLNEALDVLELQNKWQQIDDVNFIAQLIGKGKLADIADRPVYKWRNEVGQTGLKNYVHNGVQRFPSIIELTTKPLAVLDTDNWYQEHISDSISFVLKEKDKKQQKDGNVYEETVMDDEYMALIKKQFSKQFRSIHKYICIVRSDGDGIGGFLKKQVGDNPVEFKKFSDRLNDFSIFSTKAVVDYGGMPVYAGGDDMLFLAPVKHQENNGENILHLLETLNSKFQTSFPELKLTVSFGISITYYKHPMAEAIKTANDLLFYNAKKQDDKNYMAMKVQKHSGQTFNVGLKQEGGLYKSFLKLCTAGSNEDENFLNSFMYKLDDQKMIIESIAKSISADTKPAVEERLKLFLEENFNESAHLIYHAEPVKGSAGNEKPDRFFTAMIKLITEVYTAYPTLEPKKKMEKIYAALRFIHFLNAKDTDE